MFDSESGYLTPHLTHSDSSTCALPDRCVVFCSRLIMEQFFFLVRHHEHDHIELCQRLRRLRPPSPHRHRQYAAPRSQHLSYVFSRRQRHDSRRFLTDKQNLQNLRLVRSDSPTLPPPTPVVVTSGPFSSQAPPAIRTITPAPKNDCIPCCRVHPSVSITCSHLYCTTSKHVTLILLFHHMYFYCKHQCK